MSVETAISAGRAAAEALMVDECTIRRATGTSTTDQVTGTVTDVTELVYSGKCRMQSRALADRTAEAGEAHYTLSQYELQIPMTVIGVRTGDVAVVTKSALDPDLVGRSFRVTVAEHKTHATARRLPCTEGGPDE